MNPILYEKNTTSFNTNGIGTLSDAITCLVTETRNGPFELEMKYNINGIHYNDIQNDAIIWAKPNEISQEQPFRVYKISKPINGIVTVYAEHISYQLNSIPVSPYTATSAAEALSGIITYAATPCPFEMWTDVTMAGTFTNGVPTGARALLGGVRGSILDVYNGEYEFDRYTVKLHQNRGQDNGVRIAYGKNLTDLRQDEEISNVITGVYPFWKSEIYYVELPEKVVELQTNYSFPRVQPLDLSDEFEEEPTVDQLRAAAESYISKTGIDKPRVALTVSFVQLWDSSEYKNIAPLERLSLCDTVTVEFEELGVDAKAKVVKYVYDTLAERYTSMDIGESRTNLSDKIEQQNEAISNVPSKSYLEAEIERATAAITGANGGYVVLNPSVNPQEILIMDSPNKETALNVIRMNNAGIGFSRTGYNGPFTTAWTIDGRFVADFITAGTLNANLIKTGTLQSVNGLTSINMESGNANFFGNLLADQLFLRGASAGTSDVCQIKLIEMPIGDGTNAYWPTFEFYTPDGGRIFRLWEGLQSPTVPLNVNYGLGDQLSSTSGYISATASLTDNSSQLVFWQKDGAGGNAGRTRIGNSNGTGYIYVDEANATKINGRTTSWVYSSAIGANVLVGV